MPIPKRSLAPVKCGLGARAGEFSPFGMPEVVLFCLRRPPGVVLIALCTLQSGAIEVERENVLAARQPPHV